MINLYAFACDFFQWCDSRDIVSSLARPKYRMEDFNDTDLDIIVQKENIEEIITWIRSRFPVTCRYQRHDGVTIHLSGEAGFFHIDFITALEVKGISYLTVKEVLGRRSAFNGLYHTDKVDQFFILLVTHGLKHQDPAMLQKYRPFLDECLKEYPASIQSYLETLFGRDQSILVFDDIKKGKPFDVNLTEYVVNAWKTYGFTIFINMTRYYYKEIIRRFSMPKYKIAFLGVDGSGKTSLINNVREQLYDAVPVIKHCHFMPAFPWNKERDSNIVQHYPHDKTKRSYIMSVLKLVYFYLRYWLIELLPATKPVLYLYDRYIYDISVDPVRFRYNGPERNLRKIFNLFPSPDLCLIIDVTSETARMRKQEVTPAETGRQIEQYRYLKEKLTNGIIVKNEFPLEKVSRIVFDHITGRLVSLNE